VDERADGRHDHDVLSVVVADPVHSALIRFDASGTAQRRLFCLPFAGGGPSTYRLWPKSLPSDVEVVVVVLPGRDPRTRATDGTAPPGTMAELVAPSLDAIVDMQGSSPMPFSIFGHSMGALVAYELTVELERAAEQTADRGACPVPVHLFVSGRRPPDELHDGERIHGLADEPFLDAMQRHYGGVPDVVRQEPELLALFLPGLRADVHVFESYAPLTERRVQCPVRVYGGATDRRPRPELLPGWQRTAEREISVRTFPGDHFYLNEAYPDLVADIAAHWAAAVDLR
jgi:medium-chain acyl-[acyl-carrier-protein] hydrolase